MSSDPEEQAAFRETLITYSTVLEEGKYKITDYMNAVKFVTFKLMNLTNIDSYARAFPDRMEAMARAEKSPKDISAHVAMYTKNKLVNAILKQTLVPAYILNSGLHQEAILKQAMLMRTAKSEKVQQEAAACLIKELAQPEAAKVEIDVKTSSNVLDGLNSQLAALAVKQQQIIQAGGMTAHDAAVTPIVVEGQSERLED
jgi:hypothetical protein